MMKIKNLVALSLVVILLTGCDVGKPKNHKENVANIDECRKKRHESMIKKYVYEGPQEEFYTKKGYTHIKPGSYKKSTNDNTKVIEKYAINDIDISFHIKQKHSECSEGESQQYVPVMYNASLQSIIFPILPSDFYIKKIQKIPNNTKKITSCGHENQTIREVGYIKSGAIIQTKDGMSWMMGREESDFDEMNNGYSVASAICDQSKGDTLPFIIESLFND